MVLFCASDFSRPPIPKPESMIFLWSLPPMYSVWDESIFILFASSNFQNPYVGHVRFHPQLSIFVPVFCRYVGMFPGVLRYEVRRNTIIHFRSMEEFCS